MPQKLRDKEVIRLDVVSLVQGTGIRGQFEERMQKLMEEIRNRREIILLLTRFTKLSVLALQAMVTWMQAISSNQPSHVVKCN